MNLSLIRSMTRSAVFELENGKCFRPEHPFAVALNGKTIYESCNTNVFSLFSLTPSTTYTVEVDAEGVRIKLWPDVNAVRAHLEECCERMPGGLAGYSVRHYVCGRYLYCAVALADITKDAPCPTTYRVSSDAPTNEADGSFLAAAAAWSIGAGVLNLPPLRIPASKVHIVPQGKPGTNIIERYVLDDALTLDDITYNGDGSVASLRVRKRDGSVITWQAG